MSIKGKRVIYVGPADDENNKPLNTEGVAVSAITPGSVLKETAAGLDLNNNIATVFGEQLIVADKDQQRSLSVDDAWVVDENMVAILPRSGEFINILIISGATLAKGDPLTRHDTAGLLKLAATNGTQEIVGYSDEALTTSGDELVRVRIA